MKNWKGWMKEADGELVAAMELLEMAKARIVEAKENMKNSGMEDGFYGINQVQINIDKAIASAKNVKQCAQVY